MEGSSENFGPIYRDFSDEALSDAYQVGPEGYVSGAWLAITQEFQRRGLTPAEIHAMPTAMPPASESEPLSALRSVPEPPGSEDGRFDPIEVIRSELGTGRSCKDILGILEARGVEAPLAHEMLQRAGLEWLEAGEKQLDSESYIGALWAYGGGAVTAITYLYAHYFSAQPGATYFIMYGAIAYGILKILSASSRREALRRQVVID